MTKVRRKNRRHVQMRAVDGLGRLFAGMASMLDDSAQVAFSSVDGVYYPEAEAERGPASDEKKRKFSDLQKRVHSHPYTRQTIGLGDVRGNQGRRVDVKV